jgi:opacity protein-like surface antigen
MMPKLTFPNALLLAALLAGATWDVAADDADPTGWSFGGNIYLWGASIGGETASGGDLDISFSDLLKNLDMAFMGGINARKDKWTLAADLIYLNADEENKGQINFPIGPGGLPVPTETDVRLKSWVVTPTVQYNLLENDKGSLNLLGGARYLWIDVEFKAKIEGPLDTRKTKIEDSGSNWDGILGVRGQIELADKWYLPYHLDVGTGQSDLTWQAFGGLGYRFKKVDGVLGYRYMYWDFDDNDALDDLNLSGFLAGVRFRF